MSNHPPKLVELGALMKFSMRDIVSPHVPTDDVSRILDNVIADPAPTTTTTVKEAAARVGARVHVVDGVHHREPVTLDRLEPWDNLARLVRLAKVEQRYLATAIKELRHRQERLDAILGHTVLQ